MKINEDKRIAFWMLQFLLNGSGRVFWRKNIADYSAAGNRVIEPLMGIKGIPFLVFLLFVSCSCSVNNSAENQMHAGFESWVQQELKSGKQTIVFPKGIHHAYPANSGSRVLHLSNNDDGLKHILFDLSDRENLVIDGNGAELIMHGHIIPFYLRNAKNITIKNLTIDWQNPFFSQGDITEVGEDFFTVRFSKEYPATVKYDRLVFQNPDLPEPMGFNNINIINPELGRLVFKSYDEYGVGMEHTAEVIEEDLIRIHSKNIRSPLKPGYVAVFQYEGRSSPAIVAHRSSNVHLSNVTEYHAAGIANLFEGTTNVYIDSMQIIRRPESGRWYTAHHDATHFVDCRGDIHIKNCRFEFQGDDDCNIHGIYRRVFQKNGDKVLAIDLVHFQQIGVETLFAGDIVGFYDSKTLSYLGEGKLFKVVKRSSQQSLLHFENRLPDLKWEDVVVALREKDVDVQICNNHFSNHRARSLLIKTLGRVRIHDNYFHVQGAAIQINNDASTWYEAGPVEDVEIFRNIFDQCNNGGFSRATFEMFPVLVDKSSQMPIFKNVRIHHNKIIQIFKPMMIVSHTENLEFYENEVIPGEDYGFWYKGEAEPDHIQIGAGVKIGRFQEMKE